MCKLPEIKHILPDLILYIYIPDINECDPEPCDHGTCNNGVDEYTCDCDTYYTGTNCDTGS